jgi:hypothetical protein
MPDKPRITDKHQGPESGPSQQRSAASRHFFPGGRGDEITRGNSEGTDKLTVDKVVAGIDKENLKKIRDDFMAGHTEVNVLPMDALPSRFSKYCTGTYNSNLHADILSPYFDEYRKLTNELNTIAIAIAEQEREMAPEKNHSEFMRFMGEPNNRNFALSQSYRESLTGEGYRTIEKHKKEYNDHIQERNALVSSTIAALDQISNSNQG